MKNKFLNAALCASLAVSLIPGIPAAASTDLTEEEGIRIGVAIWSSTDGFGSQCKRILDEAAAALDVQIQYVNHGYAAGKVEQSVEQLSAYAGCQGIIVCASTDEEMASAIKICEENGTYLAQFFGSVSKESSPDVYQAAVDSDRYIGAAYENETENGARLAELLLEKGSRRIGFIGAEMDGERQAMMDGIQTAVSDWNAAHPEDEAVISGTQYAGTTSEEGSRAAQTLLDDDAALDGIISGGSELLRGTVAAIERAGRTDSVSAVGTGFPADLRVRLRNGSIAGASEAGSCDPLFAFLMVYQAINGSYENIGGTVLDVECPYFLVASPEDYEAYERSFVNQLPFAREDILALSTASAEELKSTAAALSIEETEDAIQ